MRKTAEVKIVLKDSPEPLVKYKDYKKKFTPISVGMQMVKLLELENTHSVLEPSAGNGQLIWALWHSGYKIPVHYFELNDNYTLQLFLYQDLNTIFMGSDFLAATNIPLFDRIIANPPFEEDTWLAHSAKMYKLLNPGGIMVCLMPMVSVRKGGTDLSGFKKRMKALGAESYPVDNWYTNKDGNKIPIHIVKIKKPDGN